MTRFVSAFIKVCVAALLTAGVAAAQSSDSVIVRLPFEVTVAGKTLPPGDYSVQVLQTGSATPSLIIRSGELTVVAVAARIPWAADEGASQTMLVLSRVENGLALSKVLIEGRNYYYQLQ